MSNYLIYDKMMNETIIKDVEVTTTENGLVCFHRKDKEEYIIEYFNIESLYSATVLPEEEQHDRL